jgi:arylsulfatase A-like enzyme/uncharacterized membrane protein
MELLKRIQRDAPQATRPAGNLSIWLGVIVLAGYFWGLSVWSSSSRYEAIDAVLLGIVYLGLAAVLHLGANRAMHAGVFPGLLASLLVGSTVVWHSHEQTRLPAGKFALITAAGVFALVYFGLLRTRSKARRSEISWSMLGLVVVCLSVFLIVAFHQSNVFRWHLLRHNKLVGTPAYYLLAKPMAEVEQDLFTSSPAAPENSLAGATDRPAASSGRRPHILFVLVDTLRADSLGGHRGNSAVMPRFTRWAEDSVVFGDVMANSSWTKPSVGSFFTGRLPEEHGAVDRGDRLPEDQFTLAEALSHNGYRTAAYVTNFAHVGRATGFDQGFDHFVELRDEGLAYARAETVTKAIRDGFSGSEPVFDATSEEPLFLYVHFLDPHMPYLSGGAESVIPEIARQAYAAELEYLDRELVDLLEFSVVALPGPWITFVTSDHGEEFGEHDGDYQRHGHSLYPEVLSVPAVLRTTSGQRGEVLAPLEARDFYDLLIEVSGAPDMDVMAWANERRRKERRVSTYLTSDYPIDRPYLRKVIVRGLEREGLFAIWSGYGETVELYDTRRDPGQRVNIARKRPELARELSRAIATSPRPWHSGGAVEMTEERRNQLRSLGYLH